VKSKISQLRLRLAIGKRLTEEQRNFILSNFKKISTLELSNQLGIDRRKIYQLYARNGLSTATNIPFSPEDEQYIRDHYATTSNKEIGMAIGRSNFSVKNKAESMGLKRTAEESRLIQEKYTTPTRFKTGSLPSGTLYDGCIRIRAPHRGISYQYIRISKSNWIPLQIYNWEQANGPVPEGKILRCKTKDTLNADPENWYITDRTEHLVKNAGREDLEDRYIASILSIRDKEKRKQFAQMPELIEVKRNQLKLRRTINELSEN
jgi:hypothetical protein